MKDMERITMMKPKGKAETLRLYDVSEVANIIRKGTFSQIVPELRNMYPLLRHDRQPDGSMADMAYVNSHLPRICFAQQMEHRKGQRVNLGYTGLVLLEVNNLTSLDEAVAIRLEASQMPQTLMAFVGASGRSVKIVCRGELSRQDANKKESRLPKADTDIALFHENLYERARLAYNAQLGVTIEKLEPRLDRICYVSMDEDCLFNPEAIPFYARAEKPAAAISLKRSTTVEPREVSPGQSRFVSMSHIFEFNLERAFDDCEDAYTEHRRYASFIGTTNETTPLTDPSGSRRFVCVMVTGDIDFNYVPEYPQLYAQLLHELENGERYWPTREQEQDLIRHNAKFQRISGLGEMLLSVIERPACEQDGQWMSLKELSTLLERHFRSYKEEAGTFRKIGNYLNRPEYRFRSEHKMHGTMYLVKLRKV